MKLLFMRHGETFWNTEGRLQGQTDIPLDEEGRRMALSCGKGMENIRVDLCVSSPLLRASETAELVLAGNREYARRSKTAFALLEEEFSGKNTAGKNRSCGSAAPDGRGFLSAETVKKIQKDGYSYYTDSRLKEASFGPWEGLISRAEGYSVPLADFSVYWTEPESPLIPAGVERLTQVTARVEAVLKDIMSAEALQDKTVLLVVHGCVMRSVMYLMSGKTAFRGKVPYNCEVIEAEPDGNGGLTELARHIYYDRSMLHDYYATMKQE